MFKRIVNFCWTHCIIFIPLIFLLFFIADLQIDFMYSDYKESLYKDPLRGPNSNVMTPFTLFLVYYVTNIFTIPMYASGDIKLITEFLLPFIPLIIYPFIIITRINKKIRLIILFGLFPFIVLVSNYNDGLVGMLILQAFGLTLYDFIIRQKTKTLAIKRNDLPINFIDIYERNIVKVVCLSFVFIPIIYYLGTKKVLWDNICDTKVE